MPNKDIKHHRLVDICGICCAQPIIRLSQELKEIQLGEVILAISDKESMNLDIPAFCARTQNQLLAMDKSDGLLQFWIRKGIKH